MEALVDYLASRSDVTLYGPRVAEPGRRVPVISFRAAGMPSAEISARLQVRGRQLADFWRLSSRLTSLRCKLSCLREPVTLRMRQAVKALPVLYPC